LAAGNVQLSIGALPSFTPFREMVKLVAVAGPKRLRSLPDVPTTFELGHSDVVIAFWAGILAPKGTSQEVVGTLNRAINNTLEQNEVVSVLEKQGIDPARGSPQYLTERMEYYASMYRPVVGAIDQTVKQQ
jgi:tripartite-type tricarboxylate transporter receptor subunit TctC